MSEKDKEIERLNKLPINDDFLTQNNAIQNAIKFNNSQWRKKIEDRIKELQELQNNWYNETNKMIIEELKLVLSLSEKEATTGSELDCSEFNVKDAYPSENNERKKEEVK